MIKRENAHHISKNSKASQILYIVQTPVSGPDPVPRCGGGTCACIRRYPTSLGNTWFNPSRQRSPNAINWPRKSSGKSSHAAIRVLISDQFAPPGAPPGSNSAFPPCFSLVLYSFWEHLQPSCDIPFYSGFSQDGLFLLVFWLFCVLS